MVLKPTATFIEADDNGYKVNGRPATTIGELLDIVNNLI